MDSYALKQNKPKLDVNKNVGKTCLSGFVWSTEEIMVICILGNELIVIAIHF